MRVFGIVLLLISVIFFVPNFFVDSQPVKAQSSLSVSLQPLITGLTQPVYVTHAGDGSNRLFVVEQAGTIRIYANGTPLGTPFLDIRDLVTSGGERGLLSVAFHPNYESNGRFFVNYTASRPNLKTIIAEYHVSSNPNVSQTSERVILSIDQPFTNHNGGQLQFGPDGYLYVGMGDGGSGGDPQGNGQNLNSLLGKILRIDVDREQPYTIPAENPFVNRDGRDEIFALGLRNPWRFTFDRLTGRLFAGDVGQNAREEIDWIERGGNYGWNRFEASLCFNPPTGCEAGASSFQFPIAEYDRDEGTTVTGGYVYRGRSFPELNGKYIFGDFGSGRIWALQEGNDGTWNRTELLNTSFNISSFGEDESGEIHVVNYSGSVLRLQADSPTPPDFFVSLIPSSAKTDQFGSSLFLVNRDSADNQLKVSSFDLSGGLQASRSRDLNPGEVFHSEDILGYLGLPAGSYGPLKVDSMSGLRFEAVSQVNSSSSTGGFFSAKKARDGSTTLVIPDIVDNGERGMAGTFRTNLGINNDGTPSEPANVQVSLIDDLGNVRATQSWAVNPSGMIQVNRIVATLLPAAEATAFKGYVKLTSSVPILAWASKIDNGTDDPSFEPGLGQAPSESGPKLLVPSVVNTDRFKSSLVVVNSRSDASIRIKLDLWSAAGEHQGAIEGLELKPGGVFRSQDIVSEFKVPSSFFGPLTIEVEKGDIGGLAAVSEVRSSNGTSGFFPAVTLVSASLQSLVLDILDTGNRGSTGTFRTNIGINNPGQETAHTRMQLVNLTGNLLAEAQIDVQPHGLKQINDIARVLLGSSKSTGFQGYLTIQSSHPIYGWASKISNGTDDPSIIVGIP